MIAKPKSPEGREMYGRVRRGYLRGYLGTEPSPKLWPYLRGDDLPADDLPDESDKPEDEPSHRAAH